MTSQPRTAAIERRLATDGVDLAVTEYEGDGPPLVLLHGIGSRAVSWWPVIDQLSARFHLYAPDLRGHGASAKPASGYLVSDYAGDLARLLDGLGLDRPLILGHSLGGMVALTWARDHPARAAGIALEDSPLRGGRATLPSFDDWLALNAMAPAEAAAAYARRYPPWSVEDCQRRATSITATARPVFTELRAEAEADLDADRITPLAAIQSPILLVYGDLDQGGMVVPADAHRLASTLPRARIAHIPGAGHTLHRDQSDAFLTMVLPFLEEHAEP